MRLARRDFAATLGLGAILIAAGSSVAALVRFLSPNLTTPLAGPIAVGVPESYPVGTLTYVAEAHVYLARDDRGFYAIVATCTHLGCTPRLDAGEFVCPCHGSRFTREGQVASGPATRALDRAFVGQAADGHLLVDRGRGVDAAYRLAG